MSSLKDLKEQVWKCNMDLCTKGLVKQTFGNVSAFNKDKAIVAIKPSGIPYDKLSVDDIVLVDLENKIVEGRLNPSSDTKTHTVLYKSFPQIGGIVHTHSTYATAWAQAKKPIPCFGTTHADYINGEILCTEDLSEAQISGDYEQETGNQILRKLGSLSPEQVRMVLVAGHGPFTWGKDPAEALNNTIMLEEIAKLAYLTLVINTGSSPVSNILMNKHFFRKHGDSSYYGQYLNSKSGEKNVYNNA